MAPLCLGGSYQTMKQLIQNLKTGETYLEDVPVPSPGPGQVLIKTTHTLVSLGTERMLVEFTRRPLYRFRPKAVFGNNGPLPISALGQHQ